MKKKNSAKKEEKRNKNVTKNGIECTHKRDRSPVPRVRIPQLTSESCAVVGSRSNRLIIGCRIFIPNDEKKHTHIKNRNPFDRKLSISFFVRSRCSIVHPFVVYVCVCAWVFRRLFSSFASANVIFYCVWHFFICCVCVCVYVYLSIYLSLCVCKKRRKMREK